MIMKAAEKKLRRSINVYDYKQACTPPPMCYDMSNVRQQFIKYIIYSTIIV